MGRRNLYSSLSVYKLDDGAFLPVDHLFSKELDPITKKSEKPGLEPISRKNLRQHRASVLRNPFNRPGELVAFVCEGVDLLPDDWEERLDEQEEDDRKERERNKPIWDDIDRRRAGHGDPVTAEDYMRAFADAGWNLSNPVKVDGDGEEVKEDQPAEDEA